MNLLRVGCSFRNARIDVREKLAFDGPKLPAALRELESRYGVEAVVLSTCNRVEIYTAKPQGQPMPDADVLAEFVAEFQTLPVAAVRETLTPLAQAEAIRHLFRVACSLDSLIVGEGQIAGQVRRAYEAAQEQGTVGPILHALFQHASGVAKRARSETGISRGHVSVSSVAVDYVRQVFDRFDDKTVLVIGAGKMGELTLRHLKDLQPRQILVANRSPEKAVAVAQGCGGKPVPWDKLDDALVESDIVLSTTGAPEPIMPRRRFDAILARRTGGTMVILDIAVPRDFDPRIHDGDRVCLYNVDDLNTVRDQQLAERRRHVPRAESIVVEEVAKFVKDWNRRKDGPVIGQLTAEVDRVRETVLAPLLDKLNGKLTDADRASIEGAFRLFQNKLLHGPIAALQEASKDGHGTLREAVMKLFGLKG